MTSAALNTNWAGAAGNAAVAFCGRWIGRGLLFAFHHPLNTGMTLLVGAGIVLGADNAMFEQTVRHPAPLFMDTASVASTAAPVTAGTPIVRHQPMPTALPHPVVKAPVVTAPVAVSIPDNVGNKDVAELQARLSQLGFFAGKIDGYYGPQTADAIRRFETKVGLKPVGAVTPDVTAAAMAYVVEPVPAPVATPKPATGVAVEQNLIADPVQAPEDDPIGRIAASAGNDTVAVATAEPAALASPTAKAPEVKRSPVLDPELVRMAQTGLSRLGFFHAEITGKFGAETARAIREFENYENYPMTGELTPDLLDVLMAEGAFN